MARIQGVDIPDRKRVEIGLTYIYGVGRSTSNKVLELAGISIDKKVGDLSIEERNRIKEAFEQKAKEGVLVEGDLRTTVKLNIKAMQDVGTYRGKRHRMGLPVRGQHTKNNARTRKGKVKTVPNKKKATK